MEQQNDKKVVYTCDLGAMIDRVSKEPRPRFIYSGIKERSLGIIFGPSKSGKTTFCENLAHCIAAGETEYLGLPIDIENRKVLFISLEEHYTNRTERNARQAEQLRIKHGDNWLVNYIVVNENLPRYIETNEDWALLKEIIDAVKPGLVLIDSFTRLHKPGIEESATANEAMKRLRELQEHTNITLGVIHHTHKLYNNPLTRDTMAGSRVIAQEADFMFGVNKTGNGKRYIKEVAFRYSQENSETVKEFIIDGNGWLQLKGETNESALISECDGRHDDTNKKLIIDYMEADNDDACKIFTASALNQEFLQDKTMSRQTLYTVLEKLCEENKIEKVSRGKYKVKVA